jgi:predicted cupin superfamily sugar epimerase
MALEKDRSAEYWIDKLDLKAHPEGGYYREVYRSPEKIPSSALADRFTGPRVYSTSIYFLLKDDEFSAFHRIKSDEIWHFYAGSPLTLHTIDPAGDHCEILLGPDPETGESFQVIIPEGSWYGASLSLPNTYALVGGTVAPGFDFEDFEIADRSDLTESFPDHNELIRQLTPYPKST